VVALALQRLQRRELLEIAAELLQVTEALEMGGRRERQSFQ
jgi:hypothetical protein